jgi:hypothetical protein
MGMPGTFESAEVLAQRTRVIAVMKRISKQIRCDTGLYRNRNANVEDGTRPAAVGYSLPNKCGVTCCWSMTTIL